MNRLGLIAASLILLTGFFITGCEPAKEIEILKGEHELRKMVERTEVHSRIFGGFFLVVGGLSSETNTNVFVKFSWKMNDGTYAISSLPLEKIRVKFDEKITTPTISFKQRESFLYYESMELQKLLDDYVVYAVITVRKNDWPIQVNLPLNK